jgi:hypothetical protein
MWYWTPDHIVWMPIATDVVRGGMWNGQRPVPRNRTLFTILTHYQLSPLIIHQTTQYYPSPLFFHHHSNKLQTYMREIAPPPVPHHALCANQKEDDIAFEDILVSIFEWLDPASLSSAARVCADWSRIVGANYRRLCRLLCDRYVIRAFYSLCIGLMPFLTCL